jgi:hypothetical protein
VVSAALDRVRGCAHERLKCAEPFNPTHLVIRTRTWTGTRVGEGAFHDADLTLPPRYRIRQLSGREVLASGGRYEAGDWVVQDLVPAYTSHGGGGYSRAQLDPQSTLRPDQRNIEAIYILVGDASGYFTIVDLDTTGPVFWRLVIRRTRDVPREGAAL